MHIALDARSNLAARSGTPATIAKPAAWRWLLAGGAAIAVTAGLIFAAVIRSESSMALYLRDNAHERACHAAAKAISIANAGVSLTFVDRCDTPVVTEMTNEPGHVIVTRVTEAPAANDGIHQAYSVLLDGRGMRRWHPLGVKLAPRHLTLDLSPLPPKT